MPSTCSDRPRRRSAAFPVLLSLLAACSLQPAPHYPRPALPLPAAEAARFALPGPIELASESARANGSDGELHCGQQTVRFHLYCSSGDTRRPFVLLVPILAGGDELMRALAQRFLDHGFDAGFCERAGPALRPPQRGPELEQLFVRTVVHQRILLRWLRETGRRPTESTFACGVSLGGMVTTVLTAVEPDLRAAAICLAGADLPAILADSQETRIEQWRRWRRATDGIAGAPLELELRRHLRSDPLHFAPFVPTDRVLLVATTLDDVVRPAHQQLLWEALGRPDRLSVPLGHYSAALVLDSIVGAIAGFYGDRLPAAAATD